MTTNPMTGTASPGTRPRSSRRPPQPGPAGSPLRPSGRTDILPAGGRFFSSASASCAEPFTSSGLRRFRLRDSAAGTGRPSRHQPPSPTSGSAAFRAGRAPERSFPMVRAIITWSLHNRLIVLLGTLVLIAAGVYSALNLNVEAYPDPTPPLVEVITQNPGASPEEMERLIGIPLETALNGMPGLEDLRSTSIAGLNDIKCQFAYGTDYWKARQEVINRIGIVSNLPSGVHARALALEPDRRDRPLRAGRAGLHAQPAQGRAGLGAQPRPEDGARRHRRDRLRRHRQAVPGPDRHPAAAAVRRDDAAGRGRDLELQRQRRRRHPHAGQPGAQRPGDRAARQGDRPARPGERRPGVRPIEARASSTTLDASVDRHHGQRRDAGLSSGNVGPGESSGHPAAALAADRSAARPTRTTSSRASS